MFKLLKTLPLFLLIFCSKVTYSQALGLNNPAPDASSILDMVATDRGILIPRMSTGDRTSIGSPANGLLVFDTSLSTFFYYDSGAGIWRTILATSTSAAIAGWSTTGNSGTTAANFIGTTDNAAFYVKTGTGAINVGTDAFAKTITLGNITGATTVNFNTGTGGTTYTTTNGIFTLNTGTGTISIGTDAAAKTLTLGNTTGATALNFNTGTGGTTYTTTNGIFTLNTGTGTISMSNDATATTLNIGTGTGVKTINIGNTTAAASNITLNAGTSGKVIIPDNVQLNLSATNASTTTEGLVLPQSASAANINSNTNEEGKIIWNSTDDILNVGTGAGVKTIGIPNGMQLFTATNAAFVIPNNITRLHVKVWGAGGGGARGDNAGADRGGGAGGGGGGYSETILTVTPNTTLNVTVGTGGAGGATDAGGNGGASSVAGTGFATVTSGGGNGGGTTPASGGTGGTGTIAGTDGEDAEVANGVDGGMGGNSPFGGNGGMRGFNDGGTNQEQEGKPGGYPGGGGGGGREENDNGGAGANGLVIIYW